MAEPWLKLSTSLLSNPKVMLLSSDLFKLWVVCLIEAKLHNEDGLLPGIGRLAYSIRQEPERIERMVERLVEGRLVDRTERGLVMHDWSQWQHVKPSATRGAVLERVHRYRGVTPRNTSGGVTENVTPVTPVEKKRREQTRGEGDSPPTPPARGARIPQHWPFTAEMEGYARSKGVSKETAHEHQVEFHRHFLQTTRNPTSANWMLRWQNSLARDLREGRVKPDAVRGPLAGEPEPVVHTPAEETFVEALQYIAGVRSVTSPRTEAIAAAAGGWDVVRSDAFDFPDWVAAWHQIGGGDGV